MKINDQKASILFRQNYYTDAQIIVKHQELKGITLKNLIVTILSTASIVASVMTTYFGLKNDIGNIRASQETEHKVNNIRIKVLEDQVTLLQKRVEAIKTEDNQTLVMAKANH